VRVGQASNPGIPPAPQKVIWHTPKEHTANGHMPRHGAVTKHDGHIVATLKPPTAQQEGTVHGIEHKPHGIEHTQFTQARGRQRGSSQKLKGHVQQSIKSFIIPILFNPVPHIVYIGLKTQQPTGGQTQQHKGNITHPNMFDTQTVKIKFSNKHELKPINILSLHLLLN